MKVFLSSSTHSDLYKLLFYIYLNNSRFRRQDALYFPSLRVHPRFVFLFTIRVCPYNIKPPLSLDDQDVFRFLPMMLFCCVSKTMYLSSDTLIRAGGLSW